MQDRLPDAEHDPIGAASLVGRDGALRVPLYHGTRALWLPSILADGLGARDPLQELDARAALAALFAIAEAALDATADGWWTMRRFVIQKLLGGGVTAGGFNFGTVGPGLYL